MIFNIIINNIKKIWDKITYILNACIFFLDQASLVECIRTRVESAWHHGGNLRRERFSLISSRSRRGHKASLPDGNKVNFCAWAAACRFEVQWQRWRLDGTAWPSLVQLHEASSLYLRTMLLFIVDDCSELPQDSSVKEWRSLPHRISGTIADLWFQGSSPCICNCDMQLEFRFYYTLCILYIFFAIDFSFAIMHFFLYQLICLIICIVYA